MYSSICHAIDVAWTRGVCSISSAVLESWWTGQISILSIQIVVAIPGPPALQLLHSNLPSRHICWVNVFLLPKSCQSKIAHRPETLHYYNAKYVERCFWLWVLRWLWDANCIFNGISAHVYVHACIKEKILLKGKTNDFLRLFVSIGKLKTLFISVLKI